MPGGGIPYPAGNPDLPRDAERAWRRRLVERALDALATTVDRPTLFCLDASGGGRA